MVIDLSDKEINYSLFGLLLGDAWIQNRAHPTRSKQLAMEHSMKQEAYMRWLEELFKHWGIYRTSTYNVLKETTYGPLNSSRLICDIPDIRHFMKFNRFYDDDGKKIVSPYVMQRIHPLGLLFWFLDDGNLVVQGRESESKNPKYDGYKWSRWATLSTYSFTKKDHEVAQFYFDKRFGISTKIHKWNPKSKNNSYLKLYFSATDFRKFYDIVRPYLRHIPEDMYYKFDMKYNAARDTEINYQSYNLPRAHGLQELILE